MKRPTLIAAGTGVLVVAGLLLGVQGDNLHNGLIALSFAVVGAVVLRRRPGNREAALFLAAGAAQAVMFVGRQVGGAQEPPVPAALADWIAWFGIWPLPLVLVLVGAAVMSFPDGHLPGRAWVVAFRATVVMGLVLAGMSVLWPVDYARAGLRTDHPLALPGLDTAQGIFDVARSVGFLSFQLLWLACMVARYRHATRSEARQLRWLVGAVTLTVVVLLAGVALDGSPRAGLLTAWLIPIAAGLAIIEATYESLLDEARDAARRVVTAQDEARRRIERDLHDGAQHRLVVLGMELGHLVEQAQASGDPALASAASAARTRLLEATEELRELARGIHPSVLTQDGLPSALAALADVSPVRVKMTLSLTEECAPTAEATAYFVVSEALTNAVRHSGATRVTVHAGTRARRLELTVADDGRGGASVAGGLLGIADRVRSLGGELEVDSPVGGGTRLRAWVPCR